MSRIGNDIEADLNSPTKVSLATLETKTDNQIFSPVYNIDQKEELHQEQGLIWLLKDILMHLWVD